MDDRKQGELRLSLKEHRRWEVLKPTAAGDRTARSAAEQLDLSIRQVRRLVKRVRAEGLTGVLHRNRGRPSNRRTPEAMIQRVQQLYDERYEGFNLTHYGQMLLEREKIKAPGRETLRKILLGAGLWERRRKAPKHRLRRPRRQRAGELLQIDASIHRWLGEHRPPLALVGAVDDATGEVPWAEFFDAETTVAYLVLLQQILQRRGVPQSLYSDRDSVFVVNNAKDREALLAQGRLPKTQFGRALKELGIEWIAAFSPQAKGRIERLWRTFQDRLLNELKLEKIGSREAANDYLHRRFLSDYNRRFRRPAANPDAAWRPQPSRRHRQSILCLKEPRTLGRDHTFSYQGKFWQVLPTAAISVLAGVRIEVRQRLDGSIEAWRAGTRLNLRVAAPTPPRLSATASGLSRRHRLAPRLASAGLRGGPREPARKASGGATHPWRRFPACQRRVTVLLGQNG